MNQIPFFLIGWLIVVDVLVPGSGLSIKAPELGRRFAALRLNESTFFGSGLPEDLSPLVLGTSEWTYLLSFLTLEELFPTRDGRDVQSEILAKFRPLFVFFVVFRFNCFKRFHISSHEWQRRRVGPFGQRSALPLLKMKCARIIEPTFRDWTMFDNPGLSARLDPVHE